MGLKFYAQVEDILFGYGNQMTFLIGTQYKGPHQESYKTFIKIQIYIHRLLVHLNYS